MQIAWAIFGERNGGHALLAASGNAGFAAKITQYTDRPGDPPPGLEWGPVVSGFYFADHYILLRTLPDVTAGRAGMVRSYAAFLPASELGLFGNLTAVFNELPSDLTKLPAVLPPIYIGEQALRLKLVSGVMPGLDYIAKQLSSSDPILPLVWSSANPYLPTVDAVWAKLPLSLRTAFAFAFQFAPEHKLPVPPTIIATNPALAVRWPSTQLIPTDNPSPYEMNTVQKWFIGRDDETGFNGVLNDYGMMVREFRELSVLSSFADMIAKLPHISFVEARKAIRILEKYSKLTNASAQKRKLLFEKLCELVQESSPEEIETLRNFDHKALADLIPLLQDSIRRRIVSAVPVAESPANYVKMLELAVADPNTWWSVPFVEWLRNLATSLTLPEAKVFCKIVFASNILTEFLSIYLFNDRANEEKILAGMSSELTQIQSKNILKFSKQRGWMRLHATCLLRTLPQLEAITLHAQAVDQSTAGLDVLYQEFGFVPLLKVACETDNQALDQYLGCLLRDNIVPLPLDFSAGCGRWSILLAHAVRLSLGPLTDPLRKLVMDALADQPKDTVGSQLLCEACCSHAISVIIAMEHPSVVLDRLDPDQKMKTLAKVNTFVLGEVLAGRRIELGDANAFRQLMDVASILNALRSIPVHNAARLGVNAFRCLRFLNDYECSQWLIDLFTRTQFDPLDAVGAADITSLLMAGEYPLSAKIVRDTVEGFERKDVSPIHASIRYKYQMAQDYGPLRETKGIRLPKVLIVTALPLERNEVMKHIGNFEYRADLYADVARWPQDHPAFEVYVLTTGAGNLDAQNATLRILNQIKKPKFAFFVGVGGGVKDSEVGDVVYGTKVYYVEGGKEEEGGIKSRPVSEHTSEALVQLAHRVAQTEWQPSRPSTDFRKPQATPAVVASGDKVLASTSENASTYQHLKTNYNDTQVVDMEAYGFLRALREREIRLRMVIRGVSDKLKNKAESDAKGNQPLAAQNAAAFLFALLRSCPDLLPARKKKLLGRLQTSERLPDHLL